MLFKKVSWYFSAASAPVEQQFRCLLFYLINEDSLGVNVFLLHINITAVVNNLRPCYNTLFYIIDNGTLGISAPAQLAVCLRLMLTNAETEESTCPLLLLHGTITMSQGFTVRTRPSLRTPSSKEDLNQSPRWCLVMGIFSELGFYLIVKVVRVGYFLFIWEEWRLALYDAITSWPIARR